MKVMKHVKVISIFIICVATSCCGRKTEFGHHFRVNEMSCADKFVENGIVPDVVDVAPQQQATVEYPGGNAECGNVLTPTIVQDAPKLISWPADDSALYTLMMQDPDAPSRANPKFREWRHWMVVNIPGNRVSEGEIRSEYIGAGPPKDTGLHRYVFMVFKQPGRISVEEPKQGLSPQGRGSTSTREFIAKYSLGNPVAGNFFQAEWDDYVPKLYKKLGG